MMLEQISELVKQPAEKQHAKYTGWWRTPQDLQDLLNRLTKGGNGDAGQFNLQDIISQVTQGAQQNQE